MPSLSLMFNSGATLQALREKKAAAAAALALSMTSSPESCGAATSADAPGNNTNSPHANENDCGQLSNQASLSTTTTATVPAVAPPPSMPSGCVLVTDYETLMDGGWTLQTMIALVSPPPLFGNVLVVPDAIMHRLDQEDKVLRSRLRDLRDGGDQYEGRRGSSGRSDRRMVGGGGRRRLEHDRSPQPPFVARIDRLAVQETELRLSRVTSAKSLLERLTPYMILQDGTSLERSMQRQKQAAAVAEAALQQDISQETPSSAETLDTEGGALLDRKVCPGGVFFQQLGLQRKHQHTPPLLRPAAIVVSHRYLQPPCGISTPSRFIDCNYTVTGVVQPELDVAATDYGGPSPTNEEGISNNEADNNERCDDVPQTTSELLDASPQSMPPPPQPHPLHNSWTFIGSQHVSGSESIPTASSSIYMKSEVAAGDPILFAREVAACAAHFAALVTTWQATNHQDSSSATTATSAPLLLRRHRVVVVSASESIRAAVGRVGHVEVMSLKDLLLGGRGLLHGKILKQPSANEEEEEKLQRDMRTKRARSPDELLSSEEGGEFALIEDTVGLGRRSPDELLIIGANVLPTDATDEMMHVAHDENQYESSSSSASSTSMISMDDVENNNNE